MSAAQVTAELQRKKNLGIMPTNQANTAQYNALPKAVAQPVSASAAVQPKGAVPSNPYTNPYSGAGVPGNAYTAPSTPQPVSTPKPITPNSNYSYGQNVNNYQTGVSAQDQIAALGKQWSDATTKEARDALHTQAMAIGQGAGGSYDANTGKWTFATPQQGSMPSGNPYTLSPDQIAQEAKYQIDKERADLVNATTTQSNTVKNNADYANQLVKDSRVLENLDFARNNNPFNGRSSYMATQLERGREVDDTYRAADLNNELNSISQDLYNFDKLAPDKQRALINEATRIERDYGLQVGSLTGQIPGMGASGQTLASKEFDYSKTRDAVSDDQWQQTFDENKAQYGEQFAYQKARDAITDANDKRDFDEQVKQNGLDNAVQWYSAKTSRQSSNNASSNANFDNLMAIYKSTGTAPAGLESYGIKAGDKLPADSTSKPASYNYQDDPNYQDDYTQIGSDPSSALTKLQSQAGAIIAEYGQTAYNNLITHAKDLINQRKP